MEQTSVIPNNQRIARNTIFLYVRMFVVLLVSLYTTRILLRVLGVEDYGIYNVVCGFVSMFGFLNTSMANAIQRFYNYEMGRNGEQEVVKVYNTALLIQTIVTVIVLLAIEIFGVWYLNNKMVIPETRLGVANLIFQFAVFSLCIMIMQVPYSAAILSYERMDYYAIVNIVDVIIKLISVIMLIYIEHDKLGFYGFMILTISVINFLLYYVYCKRYIKKIKFNYRAIDKKLFWSMLSFSGWNTLGSFAYMLKGQGVNILLNAFFGAVINAANGIASQISYAIQSFSISIVIAFKPQLTQAYACGNYHRTTNIMFSMSKISYLLLYTLSVPIILEIKYILHLWLGSNIPEYTISFSILVIVTMLAASFNTPIVQVVLAIGKLKKYQITTGIIICLILPLSWLALKFGLSPMSVYWITLLMIIINQIMCMRVLYGIFAFNIKEYIRKVIVPCLVFSLVLPCFPYLILCYMDSSIIRLGVICMSTLLIAGTLSYFVLLEEKERNILKNLVPNKRPFVRK